MTAVATTDASFSGADVDGLDRLSSEFSQAASVCDEVRAACEVIVAASFVFGPFGAAFVAYLKGTVIPWLTKVSQALQLMAKVLSARSQAQRTASAASVTYSTPTGLPATSTSEAPAPVGEQSANGPSEKPLIPGTHDVSRSVGKVLDRETLAALGEKESPFHPTVPVQSSKAEFALYDQKGQHLDLALDQGKIGEATWMGVDAKGNPQVGGNVDASFSDVDLRLHTSVPLGGGSALGLQNETTLGAHAALAAQASYDSAAGKGSASLGADGFVGVQNTTTAQLSAPYFTDRIDGTVQYGVGGAALAKVEFAPGHVVVNLTAGLAPVGLGAKVANSIDVDYGRIVDDVGAGVTSLEHSAASALGLSTKPAR